MSTEDKSTPAEKASETKWPSPIINYSNEDDDFDEDDCIDDDVGEHIVDEASEESDDNLDSYTMEEEKTPKEKKKKRKKPAATTEWKRDLPPHHALEISPDRKFLAFRYEDNAVEFYRLDKTQNSPSRKLVPVPETIGELNKLGFSVNSEHLITVGKAGFCVWSTATGSLIGRVSGLPCSLGQFDLSPNGKLLVSVDEGNKDIFLWDTRSGMKIKLNDRISVSSLGSVHFSANGKSLIFIGEDRVQAIDVARTIRNFVGDSKRKLALLSNAAATTTTKKFKPA